MVVRPTLAVVTGGSRGIGRSVTERLVRRGHRVLFTYTSDEAGAAEVVAASGGAAIPLRCDVTAADAPTLILDAAEGHGELVILVNNAGVTGPIGPLHTVSDVRPWRCQNVASGARLSASSHSSARIPVRATASITAREVTAESPGRTVM